MHGTPRNVGQNRHEENGPKWIPGPLSLVLALFFALALAWGTTGSALAAQAETTLAVVRSGGATLYDPSGAPQQELTAGTALTASGRTNDGRWAQVATTDGARGWVATERVLLFGLQYLPVRDEFQEPSQASAAGSSAATVEQTSASAADSTESLHQTGRVTTTNQRLNVRGGPGTSFAAIGQVDPGATVTATARNQAGDWIQIEQPRLAGGFGWVSARFLQLNGAADELPVSQGTSRAPSLSTLGSGNSGLSGKLVFQEGSGQSIYVHDLAGNRTTALAHGADPAISPDGRKVVFWRDEEGQHHLFTVGIDGGAEQRILTRGEMIRSPSWSPDGQRIAFSRVTGQARCRDAGYGICLPDTFPYSTMFPLKLLDQWGLSSVDAQGGDFQDLPAQPSVLAPQWGEQGIIYSGSAGIQLTSDQPGSENRSVAPDFRDQDPAMQPGGNRIVFQSQQKDHWEIFTANLDGSGVTPLTRPATTLITPMPHNVAPVWSPDGRHILFLSNRSGQWAFWVMNADGSNQRPVPVSAPITYAYQMEQVVSWGQ